MGRVTLRSEAAVGAKYGRPAEPCAMVIFGASGDLTKRLLYEAAPAALVVDQAGGRASTGTEQILEIQPTSPHQRVPLIIGSPEDVALAEEFYEERR